MNFDHSDVPFEIWCDSLEDEGLTTEDLRLLFYWNNPLHFEHASNDGYLTFLGDGYLLGSGYDHTDLFPWIYETRHRTGFGCGTVDHEDP